MTGGYFVTTIINQALPMLMLPVLVRYMSPAEFANVALFTMYLSIVNSLSGVSVPTVVSKFFFNEDKVYIAGIIGNSIYLIAALSSILILVFIILSRWVKVLFGLPLELMLLIPLTSFTFIVFSLGLIVMRNSKQVVIFSRHKIANTSINLLASILFVVVLVWSWRGRAYGIVLANVISAIAAIIYLKKEDYLSLVPSKQQLKSIVSVLIPLIPYSLQAVIISQAGIFFIQHYFSKELVGIYSIGFQVAVIVSIVADTLMLSWSPFLFEHLANKFADNKLYVARMYLAFVGIVVFGASMIAAFSGLILKIFTTPEYYSAQAFVPWFCLGFLFKSMYNFLLPILIHHNNQKFISLVTLVNMVIMLVLSFIFIPIFGAVGVAYTFSLSYFLMFVCYLWKVNQVEPLPWIRALKVWV